MATIKKTTIKKPASIMKKGGTVKKAQLGKVLSSLFGGSNRGSVRCPKGANCNDGYISEGKARRMDKRSNAKEDKEYYANERNEEKRKKKMLSQLTDKKHMPIVQRDQSTISKEEKSRPQGEGDFRPSTADQGKYGKKVKKTMKTGGMMKKSAPKKAIIKKSITKKKK